MPGLRLGHNHVWGLAMKNKLKYESSMTSLIWDIISPPVRIGICIFFLLIGILLSIIKHTVYQEVIYIFILVIVVVNKEIWSNTISKTGYIVIYIICVMVLVVTISAQVYTSRHWGSKNSIPALMGYIRLTNGEKDIVSVEESDRSGVCLADYKLDNQDITDFFTKKSGLTLKYQQSDYDNSIDIYNGKNLVGKFRKEMHKDYQVIYYQYFKEGADEI